MRITPSFGKSWVQTLAANPPANLRTIPNRPSVVLMHSRKSLQRRVQVGLGAAGHGSSRTRAENSKWSRHRIRTVRLWTATPRFLEWMFGSTLIISTIKIGVLITLKLGG